MISYVNNDKAKSEKQLSGIKGMFRINKRKIPLGIVGAMKF